MMGRSSLMIPRGTLGVAVRSNPCMQFWGILWLDLRRGYCYMTSGLAVLLFGAGVISMLTFQRH